MIGNCSTVFLSAFKRKLVIAYVGTIPLQNSPMALIQCPVLSKGVYICLLFSMCPEYVITYTIENQREYAMNKAHQTCDFLSIQNIESLWMHYVTTLVETLYPWYRCNFSSLQFYTRYVLCIVHVLEIIDYYGQHILDL